MCYLSIIILCLGSMVMSAFCQENIFSKVKKIELREKAVFYARQGYFEQALKLMEEALGQEIKSPEIVFDYIVILSWAGQCQKAIKAYEELGRKYKVPDYALPEIAKAYRTIGKYDSAVDFYIKYTKVKGKEKDAMEGLFYTYLDAGKFNKVRQFIREEAKSNKITEVDLELYLADILMRERKIDEAIAIYNRVLENNPQNMHAWLGVCEKSIIEGKTQETDAMVDKFLDREPKNIEALFCKGHILESQGEYMAAYQLYEKILGIYPNSRIALNSKYRALMDLGCNSLVKEKIERSKDELDPNIIKAVRGNEAMYRIRWEEPDSALQILEKDKNYLHHKRTSYDRIMALRLKTNMEAVVQEYEKISGKSKSEVNKEIPPWILVAVGDAYLYLQQLEKALTFYEEALAQKWDPEYGQTRMSIYHTLVGLGRYKEAGDLLEEFDQQTHVQIVDRGILKDNVRKNEITSNRNWWYLYQNRLAEAQDHILKALSRAPADTDIRTSLAQTYLWRGWPRLALEEFKIVRNQDPEDIAGEVGYCYALDENGRGTEARALAKKVFEKNPKYAHVKQLNRYLNIQDMRTITLTASKIWEDPGAEELSWSTKFEQPIAPGRKIFIDYTDRHIKEDDMKDKTKRTSAGLDLRLSRDWWILGAVSYEIDSDELGGYGQITLRPNDYLSFTGAYDSYSLAVPIRAKVFDIKGNEWNFTAGYRQSESFLSEVGVKHLNMSDNNTQWSYALRLDSALTTRAYWRTRMVLEGTATTNTKNDTAYYNPKELYSIYLIPMLEHLWFERYKKSMTDRLYVGWGVQWQKGFSDKSIWHIRYEQDYELSDVLSFLVGFSYSQENYDGAYLNVNTLDFALSYMF